MFKIRVITSNALPRGVNLFRICRLLRGNSQQRHIKLQIKLLLVFIMFVGLVVYQVMANTRQELENVFSLAVFKKIAMNTNDRTNIYSNRIPALELCQSEMYYIVK